MVDILGIGVALPPYRIDSKNAGELGLDASYFDKNEVRCTTLPLQYIKDTKNHTLQVKAEDILSPAKLGAEAVRLAVSNAGIELDKIGLILGDCITPWQTTPAEAHLIGEQLGVKIPAFDITSSTGSFPGHVNNISNWKGERLPEYIVSVVTNAPTQRVDYSVPSEAYSLGDGASAVVISAVHPGRYSVLSSNFSFDRKSSGLIKLPKFGHVSFLDNVAKRIFELTKEIIEKAISETGLSLNSTFVVPAQYSTAVIEQVSTHFNLSSDRCVNSVRDIGSNWGANSVHALQQIDPKVNEGDKVLIVSVGPSFNCGYTLVQKREAK